jgi:mandelate racemase
VVNITALRSRAVLPPFRRPPISASGRPPRAALVLFDLETDAGVTGRSYVFGFAAWTLPAIVTCAQGLFRDDRGRSAGSPRPRGEAAPADHPDRPERA